MDPLKPGDPGVVGRYRLSARLGQAGLGTVFLGRAPGGDHVTVKLVRPDLASDKTFMARFRADAATAREVGGTHVAHVVDADADGSPPWLVTEHVAGPSLEEAVAAHGALPEATLRALGAGLAEGLVAVHAADLTHRDLKPANVLLGADGPRIADYSLARALGSAGMTRTGVADVPGLPAPEQVTGGSIGPATDVFALGGVLCHAAGVAPFGEGSVAEIAQKVVRQAPKLTELPDWLREIVADCLKKRPTARPTAADLIERFTAADAAEAAAGDWLPAEVAALVTERAAALAVAVASNGRGEAAVAEGAESAQVSDRDLAEDSTDGAEAEAKQPSAVGDGDGDEPETAEVPALAAIVAAEAAEAAAAADETPVATPAVQAPPATGTKAGKATKTAKAAQKKAAKPADTDGTPTDATPVATPAVQVGDASDTDDATPVATPVAKGTKRAKKGATAATAATAAKDAETDDATPVATPAAKVPPAKGAKKAAKVTPAAAIPEADDASDEATPVATPAAKTPLAKAAKKAAPAANDAEADDATPVATPAAKALPTKGAKKATTATPTAATSEADDDATPVATPAAKAPPAKAAKKAAPAATPVAEDANDTGPDDADDATPVATPAAAAPEDAKDADAPKAAKTAAPAKKAPYDGAAPVMVPAVKRGTPAETVKVDRKPDAPTEPRAGTEAPTEVVRPLAVPPIPDAAPAPTDQAAVAPTAFIPATTPPTPSAAPATSAPSAPAPEPRPANPVIWYAVIALLGLTAAGLGLFRVTDSAWREAQTTLMGVVLPGISIVCGLAGLATLALAVLSARKQTPQATPQSDLYATPEADRAAAGTDAMR